MRDGNHYSFRRAASVWAASSTFQLDDALGGAVTTVKGLTSDCLLCRSRPEFVEVPPDLLNAMVFSFERNGLTKDDIARLPAC